MSNFMEDMLESAGHAVDAARSSGLAPKPKAGLIDRDRNPEASEISSEEKDQHRAEEQRKRAAKGAKNLRGRVVGRMTQGEATKLLIGLGAKHGVLESMQGYLVDDQGGHGGTTQRVEVKKLNADSCEVVTQASHEMIVQWNLKYVVLNP